MNATLITFQQGEKGEGCSDAGLCAALWTRLEDINSKCKGLVPFMVSKIEGSTLDKWPTNDRFVGVTYRTGKKGDRGLLLNVCPFCAKPIDHYFRDQNEGGA